jgi:hypothetical protein
MRIVVTDANIFFDLIGIEALGLFFQLDNEVHTTALVVDEFIEEDLAAIKEFVESGVLHVRAYNEEELKEVHGTGRRKGFATTGPEHTAASTRTCRYRFNRGW